MSPPPVDEASVPLHSGGASAGRAVLLTGVVFLLFVTLGALAQAANVAFGLWFTEIAIFLAVPWISLRASRLDPRRYVGLTFPGWKVAGFSFLVGIANFFAVAVPIQGLAQSLAPAWLKEIFDASQLFRNQTPVELTLIVLAVGVAAPICEEYFFRGILQQGLSRFRWGMPAAIGVTAFVFSAFHLDPIGFLARFELGVLFGWMMWRSKSVWPGVMAHAANNLVSTALYFASKGAAPTEEEPSALAIAGVAAVGLIFLGMLLWWWRNNPALLSTGSPAEPVSAPGHGLLRAMTPWVGFAVISALSLAALDYRGVVLNVYDLTHRVQALNKHPTPEEETLQAEQDGLRRRARSGEVPLERYFKAHSGGTDP